ncbi:MAG: GNAT family N-acetyltransferase [Saprospiraceae bacterium]|nr:GNAT family N-acetyltransferase [Saprospiraceae bacterium]
MFENHLFDVVKPSVRLQYELVEESNVIKILKIFKENDNPYVTEDYKDLKKLKNYYNYMQELRTSQSKHAGHDWLIKLKDTQTYVGVISIYELSRETIKDNDRKFTLGFAIGNAYHRNYYATEAIIHFFDFVKDVLGRSLVLAYTQDGNKPSKLLFQKLGFEDVTDKYMGGPDMRFYHLEI